MTSIRVFCVLGGQAEESRVYRSDLLIELVATYSLKML